MSLYSYHIILVTRDWSQSTGRAVFHYCGLYYESSYLIFGHDRRTRERAPGLTNDI